MMQNQYSSLNPGGLNVIREEGRTPYDMQMEYNDDLVDTIRHKLEVMAQISRGDFD